MLQVPAGEADEYGYRQVSAKLPEDIILDAGEALVAGIVMAGNPEATQSICLQTCETTGGLPGLNWWSNSADEPYAWQDIVVEYGADSDLTIQARGHAIR
jgi:hypothetical protein